MYKNLSEVDHQKAHKKAWGINLLKITEIQKTFNSGIVRPFFPENCSAVECLGCVVKDRLR